MPAAVVAVNPLHFQEGEEVASMDEVEVAFIKEVLAVVEEEEVDFVEGEVDGAITGGDVSKFLCYFILVDATLLLLLSLLLYLLIIRDMQLQR